MEPPGLFEEQALVRRDRPLAAENVIERRHIGALRVAALHRLIELLRIADQHHRLRRLRHRKHVGERHLRGLVHEEHVDRLERVRPRPQPGRAAADRGGAAAQRREQVLISLGEGKAVLRVFDLIGLLAALQVDSQFVGRLDRRIDQVANDLMAVGRDADFLAAAHQLANHLRAGEGLARTGRSLDRENAARQMAAEPNGGFNRRLSRAVQRLIADPRAFSEQEIARRLIRPIAAHAVVGDIVADPHQRLGHDLGRRHSCGRTRPADGGRRYPGAS